MLRGAAANVLGGIGKDAITVVFLVAVMFYQDWVLALVSFFVFPLAIHPIVGIGRRMRRVAANTQAEIGQLTTLLSQTFQGARHVKAYGMEAYEERRAAGLFDRLFALVDRAGRTRSRASPMMETLGGAAIAIVILYGGHQVIGGASTPGALFSFITALLLAYQPLKSLANLNASLQEGLAAAERVFEVLDIEPAIHDLPGARPLRLAGGEIRFEGVRFGYAPGAVALDGVSLTVPAGRTVALVGPSGAGKSTILNLIPRFFDVEEGTITIDGQDIRSVTLASLRGAIALVTQEVSLFDDTVRANIAYGRFGASPAEIEAAARAAARRRIHPGAAGGLRHACRRARRTPLGRPAPAPRDRAGDAEGRADPAARRGDFGSRQRIRTAGSGRFARADAWAHDPGHRAPAVDGAGRRSDLRRRSRADRRERPACRAARPRRPLCPAVRDAVRRRARPRGGSSECRNGVMLKLTKSRAWRRFLRSASLQRIACWVTHCYIRFVYSTNRWSIEGGDWALRLTRAGKPFIAAFWHGRLLMMPLAWHGLAPLHMLISAHRDGRIIAGAMTYFGIETIAGSTSRGGSSALREMLKRLREGGCVGITPDGPRGPAMTVSTGSSISLGSPGCPSCR